MKLYERIVDRNLLVRRVTISANHVADESSVKKETESEQLNFFTDYQALDTQRQEEAAALEKEKRVQRAVLDIKKKYGKNAMLKGISLEDGATTKERNNQIGGHKA